NVGTANWSVPGRLMAVAVDWLMLFDRFGSTSAAPAATVVDNGPTTVGITTTVTVALAPGARVPSVPTTVVPNRWALPRVDVAETKATLAGSVSATWTLVAATGPRLVTTIR